MESEDILKNELNPDSPQGSSDPNSDSQQKESFGKRFGKFVGNNKGKIAGFGGGGIVGMVLMIFGSMLSGPMQIVHAGQVIGEVVDTARDITSGLRMSRNVYKVSTGGGAYLNTAQTKRLSTFMQMPTQNFVNKLGREAGLEITTSGISGIGTGVKFTINSADDLTKFVVTADLSPKEIRKVLSKAIDDMDGNRIYKYIMKRNMNKAYGLRWYDGITRLAGKLYDASIGKVIYKLQNWIIDKQKKRAAELMQKGFTEAGQKLLTKADDAFLAIVGKEGMTKFIARQLGSVGTKFLKILPVIGWLIEVAIDYAIDRWAESEQVEEILLLAMFKSAEIATAAADIKNGTVPETDEEGNYVPAQHYLEMIATQNVYRSYETADTGNSGYINGNSVFAASDDYCSGIVQGEDESDEDFRQRYKDCIKAVEGNLENSLSSLDKTETIGSSFFSNTPLQAEFDPYFSTSDKSPEYYYGVPAQVSTVGKDTRLDSLINAIVGSVTIFGPKDVTDLMEEDFDVDELDPHDIGGTSMYGARIQQNDLSVSEGARTLTSDEEASLLRETQTYLAEQQMEKSWFARLFDVEDYHSGIATLSRDAEWDLTDSSITTQFANVVRTFAAIPKLIGKSLGTYTRAASAANPTPYDYGFGMVAYTPDQVLAEPDYWDAENYLLALAEEENDGENFDNIISDKLTKCTGATFSIDDYGIKIDWNTQTNIKKIELANGDCGDSGGGYTYFDSFLDDEKNKFYSYDGYDNYREFTGEDAVRTILANYKTMSAFAATSFDELEDNGEISGALGATGMNISETQGLLVEAMKGLGITYGSSSGGGGGGGGGNGGIVEAASEGSDLDCSDCVRFVNSVFAKADLPQALGCNTGSVGNYGYCPGFTEVSSPEPGDIVVWGNYSRGCGHNTSVGICHVGIYLGGGLVSEGGAVGGCNVAGAPWYGDGLITGYIRYVGGD